MRVVPANTDTITGAIAVLRAGGIVAHATETCYGLACDISNQAAIQKLFTVKQRDALKPVSALFADIEDAKKYTQWNQEAEQFAQKKLPGPYTLILPLTATLFPTPNGGTTIGVRISSYPLAQQLITMYGTPLSTTSANVSTAPAAYCIQDILDQRLMVDLALDSGTIAQKPSSTVVDFVDAKGDILRGEV